MFDLQHYLDNQTRLINAELEERLPADSERPAALHRAMRYSVLSGGKRLRPILCLAAADTIGQADDTALTAALAIEILHTYTLIHDDLPSMDNDALRRGKPSLHIVSGEANAILAGDALLTLAFEWLSEVQAPPPYKPNQLSLELSRASGSRGVIGGQVEDLAAEGQAANPETVDYIQRHKTAELLRCAVRMGGIAAGAPATELAALSSYGENLGVAFQIIDDLLNETSTAATLGKAVGSDRSRGKMTFVAVHGLEEARRQVKQLEEKALAALCALPRPAEPLAQLAKFICERSR